MLIIDCHNNLCDTPFYISLIVVIHTAKMYIANSISLSYLTLFYRKLFVDLCHGELCLSIESMAIHGLLKREDGQTFYLTAQKLDG